MRILWFVVWMLGVGPALAQEAPAPDDAIERAFQKEYAYLVAERAALLSREQALRADAARREAEAESSLDASQGRLLSLQQQANALEGRLEAARRAQAGLVEGRSALDAALSQAVATLEVPAIAEDAPLARRIEALGEAFEVGVEEAELRSSVRRARRPVFLGDGREVDAEVLSIGQIAAFARTEEGGGALIPAGGGALQIYGPSTPAEAEAVLKGAPPDAVGTFLFESVDKRADPPREKTFDDTLRAGGMIGKVILGLGAVLILLALWRAVAIVRGMGGGAAQADGVADSLRAQRFDEAAARASHVGGAMGRVLQEITRQADRGREELEVIAEQAIERETAVLDRFGTAMLVGASVAPLLGLLGTVSGMIVTFDVITEYGAGNPKLLSGGISEALVTTQLGLVVAIPGVLVGNLLASKAREISQTAESAALLALHHIGRARLLVMEQPSKEGGDKGQVLHG